MAQQFLPWPASHGICTTVHHGEASSKRSWWFMEVRQTGFCNAHYKSESWEELNLLKVKCQAHVRTEKSMHVSFHQMEASAPFVSAGLGTVEAGAPEVFPVAEILGNNNLQCVINEHSDLGPNQRNQKKFRALGAMFLGSWHCILIASRVEQSQNYAFMLEYFFIYLAQNEGSKVTSVKVQKIARLSNSFPENQLLSVSFAHTDQW